MIDTKALREKILDLAMRGKLVPQDPNDEPASELLKRIKAEKEELIKQKKIKPDKNESEIFKTEDGSYYEKFADGIVKSVEVPYEIPEGWEWVRIKSIYWNLGQRTPSNDFYYLDTGTIDNNCQKLDKMQISKVSCREAPSRARKIVQKDSVIFSTVRSYLKNIAVIAVDNPEDYIASTAFIVLDTLLHSSFLLFVLTSQFFLKQVSEKSTGSNYPAINDKNFNSLFIPIPPLNEQNRITEQIKFGFESIGKIDKNQSDLQQLSEQLRQKVLDVAMQGKLVAQDPNDEPASVLLEKIRAEKQRLFEEGKLKKKDLIEIEPVLTDDNAYYRNLPESWEVSTLGNIINLISGRDLRINKIIEQPDLEGIPYITGASDFHDGTVVTNRQTLEPQVTSEIGDILITVKGTVGKLGINPYFKAHIARQVMAISPYVLDKIFLQYFLLYKIFEIKSQSQSMIPGISREVLLKLTIQLPPKEEQKRISNFIQLVFEVIDQVN